MRKIRSKKFQSMPKYGFEVKDTSKNNILKRQSKNYSTNINYRRNCK